MSDNIDQQVKFKSTSQEVYDNLAEKDPNSLYFAEDTQRIYKGDTQFSDGSVDEDKFVKVYELSEHEFWAKLNSGDLQIGQYIYPQLGFVADDLPNRILYTSTSGIVSRKDMYYIMSYHLGEGRFITQVSNDFSKAKSFEPKKMLRARSPQLPWNERLYNNCLGCDNFGYLYMSVENIYVIKNEKDVYKWGVVGVNTSQMDNDLEWNLVNTFDDSGDYEYYDYISPRMAFRPFNLITSYYQPDPFDYNMYISGPMMYRDPLLATKEGGLFGFIFEDWGACRSGKGPRSGCDIHIQPYPDLTIKYYKSNGCKHFSSLPNVSLGPRCFTTNPDADNKLYYLAMPYYSDNDNIMVHSIDADGTYQCYSIVIDDSTKKGFTSAQAMQASFIRCRGNKVFVFIGNTNPICAVLDLTTGEYSNVHKFRNFTFDAEKDYSTVSNIVEGDNSICFTVFNGRICQYVCWNYTEDKIYSTAKQVVDDGFPPNEYASYCDILRQGQSNSIVAYSFNRIDKSAIIQTLSCNDLSVLHTWTLNSVYTNNQLPFFAPMHELPDNKFLVISYSDTSTPESLTSAIIDAEGNIKYCAKGSNTRGPIGQNFNRSIILPTSSEGVYLWMMLYDSNVPKTMRLIDTKNFTFTVAHTFSEDSCRPLSIDGNLLSVSYADFEGPSTSVLSLSQGTASYMCAYQKIQITNQGDITA